MLIVIISIFFMSGGAEGLHGSEHISQELDSIKFGDLLSQHKQELVNKLQTVQNPALQKLAQEELQELQQLEQQKVGDTEAILAGKKEFLDDIEALDFAEENFKEANPQGYKEFTKYLSNGNLSEGEKEKLYELFLSDGDDIVGYFEDEGYIINRETYSVFAKEYSLVISKEASAGKVHEAKEEGERQKKIYERLGSTLLHVRGMPLIEDFKKKISALAPLTGDQLIHEIRSITLFLEKDGNLKVILAALKEQDKKNLLAGKQTKHYETFVTEVRSLSPQIAARVQAFEASLLPTPPVKIGEKQVEGGITDGAKIKTNNPNFIVAETPTGETITIDKGQVPPARFLSSKSGYKIETGMPVGEFYEPTVAYEKVNQEFSPKAQKTENALAYLDHIASQEGIEKQSDVLDVVKTALKKILGYTMFLELGISKATSLQEIQSNVVPILRSNLIEYKKKLSDAETKYKADLDAHLDRYRASMEAKDKKIKEILSFLDSIGFTMIPQAITDQIIKLLNDRPGLRTQLGFNEEIIFAEGQLGIDTNIGESGELDLKDKIKFAEFVNKLIGKNGADGKPPINVKAFSTGDVPVGNRVRFEGILSKSGLMDAAGISAALANLSIQKEEKK